MGEQGVPAIGKFSPVIVPEAFAKVSYWNKRNHWIYLFFWWGRSNFSIYFVQDSLRTDAASPQKILIEGKGAAI